MRVDNQSTSSQLLRLSHQLELAKSALNFYYKEKHFAIENGSTKIVDTGSIAEEALKAIADIEKSPSQAHEIRQSFEVQVRSSLYA